MVFFEAPHRLVEMLADAARSWVARDWLPSAES